MTRKRIGRPIGSTQRQRGPVRANLEAVRNVAVGVYLIIFPPDPAHWLPSTEKRPGSRVLSKVDTQVTASNYKQTLLPRSLYYKGQ